VRPLGSIAMSCDITQRDQLERTVNEAIQRVGHIDVLVNNAGICPFVEAMDLTPEIWARTIDVNLTASFNATQLVARHMVDRGQGGRIIFITSLGENVINPNQ